MIETALNVPADSRPCDLAELNKKNSKGWTISNLATSSPKTRCAPTSRPSGRSPSSVKLRAVANRNPRRSRYRGLSSSRGGPSVADKSEARLCCTFRDLSGSRALGHRRTELTERNALFHFADPHLVVFRKSGQTIFIVHVVHGSRDLKRLLQ